ncbi:hypothetical protein GCM10007086_17390 [Photobacterium aphoticum]|nr:hypothetical protein C9I90_23495 [Photobacterium aphoticum]GHA44231.1 hypothetical protein GCM10007086_17390 [Photobacterium aphoticum]
MLILSTIDMKIDEKKANSRAALYAHLTRNPPQADRQAAQCSENDKNDNRCIETDEKHAHFVLYFSEVTKICYRIYFNL